MKKRSASVRVLYSRLFCPLFCCLQLMSLYSSGQYKEIGKLRQLLAGQRDTVNYLDTYNRLGFLLHKQDGDSTFRYGQTGVLIAARHSYLKGEAQALNNIAIGFMLKGLYHEALETYSHSYEIYKQLKDTGNMVQILMNSAIAYSFEEDLVHVRKYAGEALSLGGSMQKDSVMSMMYANYAELIPMPSDSVSYWINKAAEIAGKYQDEGALLFIRQISIKMLLKNNSTSEAYAEIQNFLHKSKQLQLEYDELEGMWLLGEYHMIQHHVDSALAVYQTMYRMAESREFVYWYVSLLEKILDCYEQLGNVQEQAKTAKKLNQALKQENKLTRSFFGGYLETMELERKNSKLQVDVAKSGAKNQLLSAAVVFILLLFTLSGIGYFRYRKFNRKLELLMTQVKNSNKKLLDDVDMKGKLLSMIAHDFRSPLNSLISTTWLLKSDDISITERDELLFHIEEESRHILSIFDRMLGWIKLQSDGYIVVPAELNLHKKFQEIARFFKDHLAQRHIHFDNRINEVLHIRTDREILQFVNRNLIQNAIKFSPEGGSIIADAELSLNSLTVSIYDEGPGIPEEKLDKLFKEFKNTDNQGGAGMAMVVCKELIERIGGKIWAERTAEGSVFRYTLPL